MNHWKAATRALVMCWAAALPLVNPAARSAAAASLAAGHEIRITTANGATVCTLGYTYTTGRSTYGVTAGHCAHSVGDLVTDRDSGATGRVAVTTTDPDPLADDFALLDFGTSPSVSAINGMPVSGMGVADPRTTVCRSGIHTPVACGQLDSRLIGSQYTVHGMAESIPGDSGAPVWQVGDDGTATVVGIWLGGHDTSAGRVRAI